MLICKSEPIVWRGKNCPRVTARCVGFHFGEMVFLRVASLGKVMIFTRRDRFFLVIFLSLFSVGEKKKIKTNRGFFAEPALNRALIWGWFPFAAALGAPNPGDKSLLMGCWAPVRFIFSFSCVDLGEKNSKKALVMRSCRNSGQRWSRVRGCQSN